MFAGRRAWELSTLSDAPMLPYGYKTMFAVSLVQPLFRRIMDPRLAQWDRTQASDAERALIHERGWEIAPPPPAIGADARAAS
jgi:hypothetical protein